MKLQICNDFPFHGVFMIKDIRRLKENATRIINEEGIIPLFRGLYLHLRELILIPYAIYRIKINKRDDPEYLINFVFNDLWGLIRPFQVSSELHELMVLLETKRLKTVLEIGTAKGGSLYLLCKIAFQDALIISIDLPGGAFGEGYPSWKLPLYKSFADRKQTLHLIRRNSHSKETKEKIENLLEGEKFNFIFIDGDHSYHGVKKDFEMYKGLLNKEGLIAFHDIVSGPEEAVGGVPRFWKEIKTKYRSMEIIESPNQGEAGIGIITLD